MFKVFGRNYEKLSFIRIYQPFALLLGRREKRKVPLLELL
jgi:hypothetical protein